MAMAVVFDFPISSIKTKSLHSNRSTNPRIRSFLPLHHQTRCSASRNSDPNYPQEEEVEELGVRAALSMLRFYKREISPILPKSCRYVPTCSEYSMEAYKKYGFAKGSVLMAWRICRCNPLGGSGFDPPRWFDEEKPSDES